MCGEVGVLVVDVCVVFRVMMIERKTEEKAVLFVTAGAGTTSGERRYVTPTPPYHMIVGRH